MGDEFHNELNDALYALVESGTLSEKECGITKRYLDKGYDALSEKQKYVLDKIIIPQTNKECARCGNNIPANELLESFTNGGYCGYCYHMIKKIDKE